MAQMESLQRARLKAQEVRRAQADLRAKQKTILQAEKDQAAAEINKKFQAITKVVPEQSENPPPENPPETPAETALEAVEEEVEEVVKEKPKKKKKRVVVVQESSSDEEYEIVLPKEKKRRSKEESPPIPRPQNPFERPFIPMMMPY